MQVFNYDLIVRSNFNKFNVTQTTVHEFPLLVETQSLVLEVLHAFYWVASVSEQLTSSKALLELEPSVITLLSISISFVKVVNNLFGNSRLDIFNLVTLMLLTL